MINKGFLRCGGKRVLSTFHTKWIPIKHSRHWPVLSSMNTGPHKRCGFCGWRIYRPQTANKKRSMGACLWINRRCMPFLKCQGSSGRGTMAATYINFKGFASTKGMVIKLGAFQQRQAQEKQHDDILRQVLNMWMALNGIGKLIFPADTYNT